jgi:hypothetical protein
LAITTFQNQALKLGYLAGQEGGPCPRLKIENHSA